MVSFELLYQTLFIVNSQQMESVSMPSESEFTTFDSWEEVEKRMQALVQEKQQLTQTLQQNNLYMRQLSDSLLQWQNGIGQVHEEYKRKFEAAKSLIVELRKENCSLRIEPARKFSLTSAFRDTTEALLWQMPSPVLPSQSRASETVSMEPSLESFEVLHKEETRPSLFGVDITVDQVTAQLLTAEELLTIRTQELEQAQRKIKELETENELVPLLKAQLEVFQSDFQAEREARERLAGEKEALAERVRVFERQAGSSIASSEDLTATSETQTLACPKCGLIISGLQPLQNHVEACLERDMFPC